MPGSMQAEGKANPEAVYTSSDKRGSLSKVRSVDNHKGQGKCRHRSSDKLPNARPAHQVVGEEGSLTNAYLALLFRRQVPQTPTPVCCFCTWSYKRWIRPSAKPIFGTKISSASAQFITLMYISKAGTITSARSSRRP